MICRHTHMYYIIRNGHPCASRIRQLNLLMASQRLPKSTYLSEAKKLIKNPSECHEIVRGLSLGARNCSRNTLTQFSQTVRVAQPRNPGLC